MKASRRLHFGRYDYAAFWPSIQSYATDRLPGEDSTVLLILLSCAGVPGCGVFTYLMGAIGNRGGDLTAAFYLVPACYAILGALIAIDGFILTPRPERMPNSPQARARVDPI